MPLDRRLRDDLRQAAESIAPDTDRGLERVTRRAESRQGVSGAMLAAAAVVVIIVFVAVILPGRRQDGSATGGVAGTGGPTPTERDAAGILGTWSVTLSASDPGVAGPGMAGDWTMRLGAGSTIDLSPPAGFRPPSGRAPDGYVHAEVGASLVTTLFARDFAAPCAGPGTYAWMINGDHLTFITVDDTCDARRTLLTTRPWSIATTSDPG